MISIMHFWWVIIPIGLFVLYKWTLRVLFGMVIIPEDKTGLVVKKFVLFGPNKTLPEGRIVEFIGDIGLGNILLNS